MNLMAGKRPRLIYGIALPLAVAVGYLLATPWEVTSLAVMLALAFALCIPILLRWHHVLLIFSWNVALTVAFLPGRPTLWMAMSALCFGLAVVNRIMGKSTWHFQAPAVTGTLLVLAAVVVVTAKAAGGWASTPSAMPTMVARVISTSCWPSLDILRSPVRAYPWNVRRSASRSFSCPA